MAATALGFDSALIGAGIGAAASLVVAWVTYRTNLRRNTTDYWSALQEAQTAFHTQIQAEIHSVQAERDALRARVDGLETRIAELLRINESLIADKLYWMQRATEAVKINCPLREGADEPPCSG